MTAKMRKRDLSDKLGSYPSAGVHSACCGCISKECRSMTQRVSYCVPYIRWALLICSSHCGWTGCDVCNYHIASPSIEHLLHLKPRLWVNPSSPAVWDSGHDFCWAQAARCVFLICNPEFLPTRCNTLMKLSPRVRVNSVQHPMCIGFNFHP